MVDTTAAEVVLLVEWSSREDSGIRQEVLAKHKLHLSKQITRAHVQHETDGDHEATDERCEQHLVLLTLLDALLPDIELQADLALATDLTEAENVLDHAIVDALDVSNLHVDARVERLTQRQD